MEWSFGELPHHHLYPIPPKDRRAGIHGTAHADPGVPATILAIPVAGEALDSKGEGESEGGSTSEEGQGAG